MGNVITVVMKQLYSITDTPVPPMHVWFDQLDTWMCHAQPQLRSHNVNLLRSRTDFQASQALGSIDHNSLSLQQHLVHG